MLYRHYVIAGNVPDSCEVVGADRYEVLTVGSKRKVAIQREIKLEYQEFLACSSSQNPYRTFFGHSNHFAVRAELGADFFHFIKDKAPLFLTGSCVPKGGHHRRLAL